MQMSRQQPRNDHAADAAIAITEGMDQFKLGVREPRLRHRVEIVAIDKVDYVGEQLR